jgi:hypothetical protein
MAVLRGVADFDTLWLRRMTIDLPSGDTYEVLSVPDLVQAKKTQRDKDWPMVRRLIETHDEEHRDGLSPEQIAFRHQEARTSELLVERARVFPETVSDLARGRPSWAKRYTVMLRRCACCFEMKRSGFERQTVPIGSLCAKNLKTGAWRHGEYRRGSRQAAKTVCIAMGRPTPTA